ncbi:MAG: hypothetical protein A2X35_13255 [Elusimicrobia bacterium GWA2_61_42]|nr:MAG: hypothetical protein A2X35_13255 [Elusimicrobia bacterium GWA2_61_42]OGR77506.1 MAG: hypothetical protein A2X38_10525 [Elusimicrobia bacterium GWC2_61_25]
MNKIIFIFISLLLMSSKTEAGQPGAFAQLSEAAAAAVPAVPVPSPDRARPAAGLSLVRSIKSKYWERIDCYRDSARPFVQERYLEKTRHENQEVVQGFGSKFPATSDFLLHYGPKWNVNKGKVIVLAHGASDNASRAWADPDSLQGNPGQPGALQALEAAGFRVFAVTFPHKHGNIFYEAQYLADAIGLIRQATGAQKVTLIGHSAGGLAARVYVSDYRLNGGRWTAYGNDVENLVTLAAPHRGQDFAFRHPEFNYHFMKDDMSANGPMSWDKVLAYGTWKDTLEYSIYSDNFPMQQQVLFNWTGTYPMAASSPDAYTTLHGGQGFMSHSLGIDNAIMKGGNFINNFRSYPVPADIRVTVVAGNNNKIVNVPATEKDGPSDGLVFVESASHTADLVHPARKEPIKVLVVGENHLTITYSPAMLKLIPALVK